MLVQMHRRPCPLCTQYINYYIVLNTGALTDGERLLLGGSWLYFRQVEFFEPECSRQVKPPLGEGRICLTNLRMLLLCAEMAPGRAGQQHAAITSSGEIMHNFTFQRSMIDLGNVIKILFDVSFYFPNTS